MRATTKIPLQPKHTIEGHKGPIYVVKYSKDGNYCMSGSQDKSIHLYNPHKNMLIRSYVGPHNYEVNDIAISVDNSRFASVGGDKLVFLWDVTTGKLLRKFYGHNARVNTVAWNEDCSVLASGSFDSTLRFWDIRSNANQEIQICKNFKDSVSKVKIVNEQVITGCMDGFLRTFDVRMGEIVTDDVKAPICSIDVSHDKKVVLASCTDSKVRLYDRGNGDLLNEFFGHKTESYVIEARFLWGDSYILSGSEDGIVYIYDIMQSKPVYRVKNHVRVVSCLDVSPKKDSFVSGSFDGKITLWADKDEDVL